MGYHSRQLFVYSGPALAVAASPLLSPWLDVAGFTSIFPFFAFAGGTSTHSIEGSFDGANADADFGYAAPVSGTAFAVVSPFLRWKTVQTVGDATKSKVVLAYRL
jgi:hypothetical protein